MAKGTSSSDVHFSVPEGADPLGIGVLDLGRSSYDPIDTIRRFNETRRQNRLIRQDRDREDYQNFMKNMPTVSGVNRNIATNMNKDILEMGKLFKQQQSLGAFGGFAKTGKDKDEKVSTKLSQLENKVSTDAPIYKHYSDQYEKDFAYLQDPKNRSEIDWELTNKNITELDAAKDVETFSKPFTENGGSIVVIKPTPVNMMEEVTGRLTDYLPEEAVLSYTQAWDPATNKLKTEEVTGIDPVELERAMLSVYDDMMVEENEFANDIHRRYQDAPASEKLTEDKVVIDEKAWFVGRYVPGYQDKIKTGYVAKSKDADKEDEDGVDLSKMFSGVSFDDGAMILGSPGIKPIVRQRTRQVKGPDWRKKKPTMVDEPYAVDEQYYAYTGELSGVIDKPFPMESSTDTYNQQTGERIPAGMVVYEQPTNVSMMPTASEKIVVDMPDGTVETVEKGEPIKREIYDQMQNQKLLDKTYWDWFVTSASQIKKTTQGGTEAAERHPIFGDTYIPTHQITTMRPWADARNAILSEASAKYDLTEMANVMEQMKRQKNSGVEDIVNAVKEKTVDELNAELFK